MSDVPTCPRTETSGYHRLIPLLDTTPLAIVREHYDIRIHRTPRLVMNEAGLTAAKEAFKGVAVERIVDQEVVIVRDRRLRHETIFNALRGLRGRQTAGTDAAEAIEERLASQGCRWCDLDRWHVRNEGMFSDSFGELRVGDRFSARANWARLSPFSGIAYGDECAHNLLRLAETDFVSMFEAAERYVRRAHQDVERPRFFVVLMNGGHKSAGSVEHAHLQIAGRSDRHFPFPESIAEVAHTGYWKSVAKVHQAAGLAFPAGQCEGWVSLCPMRDREVTICSPTLRDGAVAVFHVLQALIRQGTNSFSLAAILSPSYVSLASSDPRFADWPPVVWRLADRGDYGVRHSDVGSLELLTNAWVTSNDPWEVVRWLQESRGDAEPAL